MGSSPEPAGNFSLITSILLSITEGWASQPKRSLAGLVMNAPEDKAMWKIRFAQLLAELEGASDEVVDRRFEAFSEELVGAIAKTLVTSSSPHLFKEMVRSLELLNTINPQQFQLSLWVHTEDLNLPIAGPGDKIVATIDHAFPDSEPEP